VANQEKRTAVDWFAFLSADFLFPARFQALIITLLRLRAEGSLATNCRGFSQFTLRNASIYILLESMSGRGIV
jgi:hypothetical protein